MVLDKKVIDISSNLIIMEDQMNEHKEPKDFPLALTASDIAKILGLSRAGAYNLLNTQGFPTLRVGKRKIVMRDKFIAWVDANTDITL